MLKNFKLNLCSNYKRHQEVDVPSKENQVIDGVTLGGEKKFGIRSYLHNFYLSPTIEDIETHGAWYLLPPPPAQRMGLFICRILTVVGLFLLLGGATAIIVGYTWPHEEIEDSIMRIAIHQDEDGNFYIPRDERFKEVLRDPMKQWKMMGFCVFSLGASLMAISLLVPTCANLVGGRRLAAFASGDNSPNEPPIRIYPSATPKFKISPTKLTAGHKISPTSGPVPVMEEIAKVQPDKKSSKDSSRSPSAEDLLMKDNDSLPLIR